MLSFLFALLIIWCLWKLGIGFLKILGFLIVLGLTLAFVSYLLLPMLAIAAAGCLVGLLVKN